MAGLGAARAPAAVVPLLRRRPRTLFVASEMADFVQAGGLGAVAATLPRALRPHADVRVLLPGYTQVLAKAGPVEVVASLPGAGEIPPCSIGLCRLPDGLVAALVLCAELYDRPGQIYVDETGADWPDNDIRFARLSLAAAEIAGGALPGWRPELLHLNDWQSALAAGYCAWRGLPTPCLLTVHNPAHQGLFAMARAPALGIPESALGIEGAEFHSRISFLKAGLNCARQVNTVSAAYVEEIVGERGGMGLGGLFAKLRDDGRLHGLLNGIDDEAWNPRTDPHCDYNWDIVRWKTRYADYLRGMFSLSLSRTPLFAFISRLVDQKGVDLVLEAAEGLVGRGAQLIVIGRGEPTAERAFKDLADREPGAVGLRLGFDAEEARKTFAGADFLLMPSRFEPCGQSQMYAQRYGALPIAARTGGLAETVEDGVGGFLFPSGDAAGFQDAIERAFEAYRSPRRLGEMRRAAMARRFDWSLSAAAYGELYRSALRA